MSGKKGMKKYPVGIREKVLEKIGAGESQRSLSAEYGISRYAIQSWIKGNGIPKSRSRKPAKTLAEYKRENERLKMENNLLRDFLRLTFVVYHFSGLIFDYILFLCSWPSSHWKEVGMDFCPQKSV